MRYGKQCLANSYLPFAFVFLYGALDNVIFFFFLTLVDGLALVLISVLDGLLKPIYSTLERCSNNDNVASDVALCSMDSNISRIFYM